MVGACVTGRHVWRGACMARGVCMAGGLCVAGGHVWQGSMHGGGVMHGEGMHGRGHAWQERWPLQRAVCILLEFILVSVNHFAVLIISRPNFRLVLYYRSGLSPQVLERFWDTISTLKHTLLPGSRRIYLTSARKHKQTFNKK